MYKFRLNTTQRTRLIDITDKIQQMVSKSNVNDGICFITVPHTTAGITINENADPAVKSDIAGALNKLIPEHSGYAHAEGNSDSHIKSSLLGNSLTVLVENGRLCLGTWQGVFFAESDGPRKREVWVKFMSSR